MKDFVTINTSANISFLSILLFFVTSESYVKLLIRGKNLPREKEEFLEKIFAEVVEKYVKFNVFSNDNVSQTVKAFIDHLNATYKVLLTTLGMGSLIIILGCPSLKSLELLWTDYRSGHLNKVAERYLVTDEVRKKLNLETICLETAMITEENYQNCKEALMKLSSTCSGEYKQNI